MLKKTQQELAPFRENANYTKNIDFRKIAKEYLVKLFELTTISEINKFVQEYNASLSKTKNSKLLSQKIANKINSNFQIAKQQILTPVKQKNNNHPQTFKLSPKLQKAAAQKKYRNNTTLLLSKLKNEGDYTPKAKRLIKQFEPRFFLYLVQQGHIPQTLPQKKKKADKDFREFTAEERKESLRPSKGEGYYKISAQQKLGEGIRMTGSSKTLNLKGEWKMAQQREAKKQPLSINLKNWKKDPDNNNKNK